MKPLTSLAARLLAAVLSTAAVPTATAATVHTWIDEDGVRHFSDAPPGEVSTPSELIEIRQPAPAQSAGEDPNSIVNQWARVREERLERERLNLERREARRAAEQTAAEIASLEREPEFDDRAPAFVLPYPTRRLGYGVRPGIGRPHDRDRFYRGRVDNRQRYNYGQFGQRKGRAVPAGDGYRGGRQRSGGFNAAPE